MLNWRQLAITGLLVVGAVFGTHELTVHAQQQFPPPCEVTIPSEWGELKGVSEKIGMVFEDKFGTIRVISDMPCTTPGAVLSKPNVQVEIRRSK
jgi:hypothetical protein